MQAFHSHSGIIAPLAAANVDTDQIIPKQFLQRIDRQGFGVNLFHDWRYLDLEGNIENPDFILNKPNYRQASILVARQNFGCGSSREHAPWALQDFGFQVIIAPSFADIFYGNCFNIGLLPIVLESTEIEDILAIAAQEQTQAQVDLPKQTVSIGTVEYHFDIDPSRKALLLAGLDAIGASLQFDEVISQYEANLPSWRK